MQEDAKSKEENERRAKMTEIIDLLMAAGYFRARIKGLTDFDKVVGGICWCIQFTNEEIDIDILFQENSTIGQKISLTEKLVKVLLKMKCPHRIEPHQIQGLDLFHIHPVVQWLVRKAIESAKEQADHLKSFAIYQFDKCRTDRPTDVGRPFPMELLAKPQRLYKRKLPGGRVDELTKVKWTLFEFGRRVAGSSVDSALSLDGTVGPDSQPVVDADQPAQVLSEKARTKQTAAAVGNLVMASSSKLNEAASGYERLERQRTPLVTVDSLLGLAAAGQAKVPSFQEVSSELQQTENRHSELRDRLSKLEEMIEEKRSCWKKLKLDNERLEERAGQFDRIQEDRPEQVAVFHQLLQQRKSVGRRLEEAEVVGQQQVDQLRSQLDAVRNELNNLKTGKEGTAVGKSSTEQQRLEAVAEKESTRLKSCRLELAKTNRELINWQRKLERNPSRVELAQYQRRFLELFDEIAVLHRQTKQFYTLFNTLHDKRTYAQRQIQLLESIGNGYKQLAPFFKANKRLSGQQQSSVEEFMKQLEAMTTQIGQMQYRLEEKRSKERARRDQLLAEINRLLQVRRNYYKAVNDLDHQLRLNHQLTASSRS